MASRAPLWLLFAGHLGGESRGAETFVGASENLKDLQESIYPTYYAWAQIAELRETCQTTELVITHLLIGGRWWVAADARPEDL